MRISDWSSDVCSSDLFFDILDTMVAKCPEVRSNVGDGYWMVTRHEDVRRVGQDWKTFSSAKGYVPNRPDRKSVVEGKSVSVRVDLGGRRIIKKKKRNKYRIMRHTSTYQSIK